MATPNKALLIQARDALEHIQRCIGFGTATIHYSSATWCQTNDAIAALQAAIDAPEPEPEALRHSYDGYGWLYVDNGSGSNWKCQQYPDGEFLYTRPPEVRKPLSDAEIDAAWRSVDYQASYDQFRRDVGRAIEAAHGIKP